MANPVEDQVIDFYRALFNEIFSERFRPQIAERIRRDEVFRQVEAAADAASQSLTRFFLNEQLSEDEAANILSGFTGLASLLKLEKIANPNIAPESVVEELLAEMSCPKAVKQRRQDAVYRVALHSVVQALMLVGRVMGEWQRLSFSSTFELPRRVIDQLNAISEQLNALGLSGQAAGDERFELTYRDYLMQRFYRVEAGTVRMTTNMDVDIRELFVMPRVLARPQRIKSDGTTILDQATPMDLAAARVIFGGRNEPEEGEDTTKKKKKRDIQALTQVKRSPRNMIIGAPGSGKSTFFEWLQLKLASVQVKHVLGEGQAIPLLLRVRQLNPKKLPKISELIEKAIASKDRATLMPKGWLKRQMEAGRVLFMLDGLDETEPELCDYYVIPWLAEMCEQYSECGYLISSRPVGYPPGALRPLGFTECDLLDFGDSEIAAYVKHWCTAIRLAQNEPKEEARRDGAAEGKQIVEDFERNSYVKNLARNPLMLSAICLVNYFERGKLPEDRAWLYKLCVEGLLHHWDQRRGIHSEFTLDEKLRACRAVALAMQADDRAEYEAPKVLRIFSVTLGDPDRARRLLEHIRYRTGLLVERRAGMFAFAHLTFQEYLAAQAVYEGNLAGIDAKRLAQDHSDGRWTEVIALYCGSASAKAARVMIEKLIAQPDTEKLSKVLAEAYLSSGPKLSQDKKLRLKVVKRIATAPGRWSSQLSRFTPEEVEPIANSLLGKTDSKCFTECYIWLIGNPQFMSESTLLNRLQKREAMNPEQVAQLVLILHRWGTPNTLLRLASDPDLYAMPGAKFANSAKYVIQAETALMALFLRIIPEADRQGVTVVLLQILRALSRIEFKLENINTLAVFFPHFIENIIRGVEPENSATRIEFASLARQWAEKLTMDSNVNPNLLNSADKIREYADSLEEAADVKDTRTGKKKSKAKASDRKVNKTSKRKR